MSDPQNPPAPVNPIDAPVAALIQCKARALVGRSGLTRQDCADVEQELALRLLAPLGAFDPTKGERLTYAWVLIERFAHNLLRDRRAAKRAPGPLAPLPADLAGTDAGTDPARVLDVGAAVSGLPEHLRRVAELVATGTVAAAARDLGVSRATVYARLAELRARAEFRALVENP